MTAGQILLSGIFNGSRLLEVPFYQRAYVWDEEQWERFLSDMEFITNTRKPYFLGSIILKPGAQPNTWDHFSDCKVIIDGQQRLTTLMLFFKALCLKKGENTLFDRDFRLEDNTIALHHGRSDAQAFLKATALTQPQTLPSDDASQIAAAFNYFMQHIDPTKVDRTVIRQNMQFVCIDLLENEDEQQVFDTINSLGVRLSTAELLKNYFYSSDSVQEYEEGWAAVFERDQETRLYWDQELETGRMKRSLIDIFFDAYFQLFIQDRHYNVSTEDKLAYARLDRLSKSYQEFIRDYCGGDKQIILGPLAEYASCFIETFCPECCDMCLATQSGIDRINLIIFGLKTSTLLPYVLYVAKNVPDAETRDSIYAILESYIMRRMVVHATTKNYNNLFTSLIQNQVLDPEALLARLRRSPDASTFIPGDAELLDGFCTAKLINQQTKGILYLLESGIRPPHASTALMGFDSYSLEHLLPKKWRNHWPRCETPEQEQQRDHMLLTLGNLAIIPHALNASIRDSAWALKKSGKASHPGLTLCAAGLVTMQDALTKDAWTEEEIAKRAHWLFEQARIVWPL